MKTEVLVIVDNTANGTLLGEWGLCLLVRHRGKKILVDAGATDLFLKNMKALDETVEDIDFAVLSHAHSDHANGMPAFFENNSNAKLYMRDAAAADCYKRILLLKKYIGMPRNMLDEYEERIEKVSGVYQLSEGAYLIPHATAGLSAIGKRERMYRRTGRTWTPDDFSHEQSLVLDTEKGLLIINACSHGGVLNTMNEVGEVFPEKPIYGYIGGFHLFNKSNAVIEEVADALKETTLDYVCTGHCTKERAYGILKQKLGDKVEQLHVGLRIEI